MRFLVDWMTEVYDPSEDEDRTETGTPFEIQAGSLEEAINSADDEVRAKVKSMHWHRLGGIGGVYDGHVSSVKGIDNNGVYIRKQEDDEK